MSAVSGKRGTLGRNETKRDGAWAREESVLLIQELLRRHCNFEVIEINGLEYALGILV